VIGITVAALPGSGNLLPDSPEVVTELDSLRLLLLQTAEALGRGDAFEVERACNDLSSGAVNLRPAFGDLFPNRNGALSVDCEQARRRLLLPLLEARALYLAALRRWRRSLSLRRSLLDIRRDTLAYGEAEVSRWY